MRSQMLHTNRSFELCQERMFVKQHQKDGWSIHLLSKKIFMLKQKSSNLYMICFKSAKKLLSNYLCTLHWHAFTNALHKQVIWNLPRANVCEAVSNTRLKHLLAVEKNIYAQAKTSNLYVMPEWLFIHITLETAPIEIQCDETISHMVTAGQSYFPILWNACVTAGKTIMTAGRIYHGCFEMLSWPHRMSNNIINICFRLLETCTRCSYFAAENMRPRAWSEVQVYRPPVHEYIMGRRSMFGQVPDHRRLMC